MWLIYFINAMRSSLAANLTPFVLSAFESHSLIPVIDVVSSICSASVYMPLAKILNMWDRSLGFSCMIGLSTLGMILMAACNSFEVYAAANVFYSIGFAGVIFSVDVMTSDISSMKSRGLAFAFTSSPFLITAFAGPKASETIYEDNWRWGFGAWAIVLPAIAVPMTALMQMGKKKARENGHLAKAEDVVASRGRGFMYYFDEFDMLSYAASPRVVVEVDVPNEPVRLIRKPSSPVVGVFLLLAGFVLFLLPFTIAASSDDTWRSAHIIAMLVLGVLLISGFALWERFGAKSPFVPWHLLRDRNVLGACCLSACYQISYYCWASYFTSYLQVVYDISISSAGYIASIFDVVNGVNLFLVGFLIRWSGRFKWILVAGVPLYMLGQALLIYFRQPSFPVGYTVMCQVFMALAGGAMILGQQVSVMSVCRHNDVAAVLAMLNLFGNLGGGIGNSISGAIWTNTLPQKLQQLLPAAAAADWSAIYDSLDVQLSYPVGSDERAAIIASYAGTQRLMLITGTCVMVLGMLCVFVMRDVNVKKVHQVKGMVF
ncbi:hypothetical protein E4U43_005639 [Claviceps pusilla]|uniref:Major facilitator MirA n=1 Tax=Claviceps pusilla TaxID=123648 RepID=A0A9P7N4L6_9HYPO|nr:hypothetical protein E4U43_005639 [Claviceps pusilla]